MDLQRKTDIPEKIAAVKETIKTNERNNQESAATNSKESSDSNNAGIFDLHDSEPVIVQSKSEVNFGETVVVKQNTTIDGNEEVDHSKQTQTQLVNKDVLVTWSTSNSIVTQSKHQLNSNNCLLLESLPQNALGVIEGTSLSPCLDETIFQIPKIISPIKTPPECKKVYENESNKCVARSAEAFHDPEELKEKEMIGSKPKISQCLFSSVTGTPKTTLESLTIGHVVSKRKLNISLRSKSDMDINEDPSIIPISPGSKCSLKYVTLAPNWKRLTDDDIKRRSQQEQKESPWDVAKKRQTKSIKKAKCAIDLDNDKHKDESYHEHKDFSVFKTLDDVQNEENDERVFMTNKGDSVAGKDPQAKLTSINLLSQSSSLPMEGNKTSDLYVPYLTDTIKDSCNRNSFEILHVPQTCGKVNKKVDSPGCQVTDELKSFHMQKDNILSIQNKTKKRERERKRITPKDKSSQENKPKKMQETSRLHVPSPKASMLLKEGMKKHKKVSQEIKKSITFGNDNISSYDIKCNTYFQAKKSKESKTSKKEKKSNAQISLVELMDTNDGTTITYENKQHCAVTDIPHEVKVSHIPVFKKQTISQSGSKMVLHKIDNGEGDFLESICFGAKYKHKCAEQIDLVVLKSQMEQTKAVMEEAVDNNSAEPTLVLHNCNKVKRQKIPESRNFTKSTESSITKHKKAITEKRIQKQHRSVFIKEYKSNSHAEKHPLATLRKTNDSLEERVKKLVKTNSANEKILHKEVNEAYKKTVANQSEQNTHPDDNINLIEDQEKVKKQKISVYTGDSHIKLTHSHKGRSANVIRTRLRHTEKGKTSPWESKSLSLVLQRTRSSEAKLKFKEDTSRTEKVVKFDVNNKGILIPAKNKNVHSDTIEILNKFNEKIKSAVENSKELQEVNLILPESDQDNLSQVRKINLCDHQKQDTVRNIDSNNKLIENGSEKSGLARRGILKTPSVYSSAEEITSPQKTFCPIKPVRVRVYSPTASPSACIPKKRQLSESSVSDTNLLLKHRRVSFASPLVEDDESLGKSAKVDKVNVVSSDVKSDTVKHVKVIWRMQDMSIVTTAKKTLDSQSTHTTSSLKNYKSSEVDIELDHTKPVFPELVNSNVSVDMILPQLTSSVWARGLGQLVRARNIHTIGDLSALTESDIDCLPIKLPKVDTVRKVLSKFMQKRRPVHGSQLQLENKLGKDADTKAIRKPSKLDIQRSSVTLNEEKEVKSVETVSRLTGSVDLLVDGNILAMQSNYMEDGKSDAKDPFNVLRCSNIAVVKVAEITELIHKALDNDRLERTKGGKFGFAESVSLGQVTTNHVAVKPIDISSVEGQMASAVLHGSDDNEINSDLDTSEVEEEEQVVIMDKGFGAIGTGGTSTWNIDDEMTELHEEQKSQSKLSGPKLQQHVSAAGAVEDLSEEEITETLEQQSLFSTNKNSEDILPVHSTANSGQKRRKKRKS